jgi:hypothetical protein
MNLDRKIAIAANINFFEAALPLLAARHFFTEAVRCAEPQPMLSLAGITCLICGIEGALRFSLNEQEKDQKQDETQDLDGGGNLNNCLLRRAANLGFNIEVLAFPEEQGSMKQIVSKAKPRASLVEWRNEFAHGRAFRTAERIGEYVFSDSIMMGPAFRELFIISYKFSSELARFRRVGFDRPHPPNLF